MTYGKEQQTSKPIFNISLSHLLFFVTTLSSLLQGVGLEPTTISSLFTWLLAQLGEGNVTHFFILALYQLSYPCMVGGFFIAVCVALYAYEYGNLPETAISVKWHFATCAGHILISKAGNVDGCC